MERRLALTSLSWVLEKWPDYKPVTPLRHLQVIIPPIWQCNASQLHCWNVEGLKCGDSSLYSIWLNIHCEHFIRSVVVIRCRRSYYKEQWMGVIAEEDLANHGKTTNIREWTDQSMSSRLRITDDWGQLTVIAANVSVGVPNDAWALLVLVRAFHTLGRVAFIYAEL